MARAPLQVLVLPFRQLTGDDLAFAVFRRSDDSAWQGLAGGGEGSESPIEAARREAREEAGIPPTTPLYLLEMMDFVPVTCFSARAEWPTDTYLVPQHFFAVDVGGQELRLSHEHTELRWATYAEAYSLLTYDSNKTALWELSERLARGDLQLASPAPKIGTRCRS